MQKSQESRKLSRPWLRLWATGIALLVVAVILLAPPASLLGKCDAVGYAICHRIPERSFHLAGRQLPLCARCTGTYLGALVGFATMWALGHRRASNLPPTRVIVLLVGFIASMGSKTAGKLRVHSPVWMQRERSNSTMTSLPS